jgi:hypothetical protein
VKFLHLRKAACCVFAMLSGPPRAHAQNGVEEIGKNFFVETTTGHVGIATTRPAKAIDAGAGEVKVGSSGATCAHANEGTIRYADTKLQFCHGAGRRSLSSASTRP